MMKKEIGIDQTILTTVINNENLQSKQRKILEIK